MGTLTTNHFFINENRQIVHLFVSRLDRSFRWSWKRTDSQSNAALIRHRNLGFKKYRWFVALIV